MGPRGHAALDALASAVQTLPRWRVRAGSGKGFLVNNHRVLHGRAGQVVGRRRVVGGEAPMSVMRERWAQVAAVQQEPSPSASSGV